MVMNHAGCYAQHEGFLFFQIVAEKGLFFGKSASKVQVKQKENTIKTLNFNEKIMFSCSPTRTRT